MCSASTIYNQVTGQHIETPRQLREVVGAALCPPCDLPEAEDECLCWHDVAGILAAAGIDYEGEDGFTIHHPPADGRPLE